MAELAPRGGLPYPFAVGSFAGALIRYLGALLCRRVELLHVNLSANGSTARKIWFVAINRLCGVPTIIHLHGSDYVEFWARLPAPARRAVRWMFETADRVIVLGRYWEDFLVRDVGVAARRIVVLPNAVPPIKPHLCRPAGPCRILFLGRVGDRKGVPELLAALAAPALRGLDWAATVAGDGEGADLARFRAAAAATGIGGRVEFAGWVGAAEARDLLRDADIFVLPSRTENLPVAVLEAMAAGLAIVTTPVGALPEVLTPEIDALFVPPGDAAALCSALRALVVDGALRARLGRAALTRYSARYGLAAYVDRLGAIYRDVLSERRAGPAVPLAELPPALDDAGSAGS